LGANLPKPIVRTGLPQIRQVVYAEPGVGKTTYALTFPHPLVIDTDGGLEGDAVVDASGESWTPEKWQDLNSLYFHVRDKVKTEGWKTIVIDSGDMLSAFLRFEAMDQKQGSRPANARTTQMIQTEQPDYGKVAVAWEQFLANLRKLPCHIVITAGVREIDPDKGRFKRTANFQPAVLNAVNHWANLIGEMTLIEKDGVERRVLWLSPGNKTAQCKSRWAALGKYVADPTFSKIREQILADQGSTEDPTKKGTK